MKLSISNLGFFIGIFCNLFPCSMAAMSTITSHIDRDQPDKNPDVEYFPTSLQKKAITLVVHGLNVKPRAMTGLIEWLNQQGSDAFLIKLMGHDENATNISDVSSEQWEKDMFNGYEVANKASRESMVPLYFVGYSLGALLGQHMIQFSANDVHFEKQILIAPATAIRSRSHMLKLLFFLDEKKELPSYTPEVYRANEGLPLKVYKIMFKKEKEVCASRFTKLNIPTLILIDPKDELISYRKLKRFERKFSLTQHEIIILDSDLKARGGQYHHLIINEATMGKQNWKRVTEKLKYFLFQPR